MKTSKGKNKVINSMPADKTYHNSKKRHTKRKNDS